MRRKRVQLMGGISGKLPLCGKGAVVTQVQLMLDGEYQLMLGSVPISRPILPTGGVQPMAE